MADPSPPGGPPVPNAPPESWLGKNGVALLTAFFSLAGACLAGWVTFQTHGTDARVAELQQRNTRAQNFEARIFENVDKLLNKNREASRLYLIGLYGQARDDPANKVMVASIAAASCNKDLLTTLTTLINSNDNDKREFAQAGFANSLDAWNSLCVVSVSSPAPGSSNTSKIIEATPPPETVKARALLIASLTPAGSTGWIKLGFAPLGTETKPCVELKLDPPNALKILDPTATCPPNAAASLVLPRDIKDHPLRLQVLTSSKLYAAAAETATGTGIATANRVVKLTDNVKGVDLYDAHGVKTGYTVWANVELEQPVVNDIPARTVQTSASGRPAATSPSPATTSTPVATPEATP